MKAVGRPFLVELDGYGDQVLVPIHLIVAGRVLRISAANEAVVLVLVDDLTLRCRALSKEKSFYLTEWMHMDVRAWLEQHSYYRLSFVFLLVTHRFTLPH